MKKIMLIFIKKIYIIFFKYENIAIVSFNIAESSLNYSKLVPVAVLAPRGTDWLDTGRSSYTGLEYTTNKTMYM